MDSLAGERRPNKPPQENITSFWNRFISKSPSKAHTIFPPSLYSSLLPRPTSQASSSSVQNFGSSYEETASRVRNRVARIVRDCHRTNSKYTDPDFDLRGNSSDCLLGLTWDAPPARGNPRDVKDAIETLENNGLLIGDQPLTVHRHALKNVLGRRRLWEADAEGVPDYDPHPGATHRVDWIYEDPKFIVDGYDSSDILQGNHSMDCWWLSAVATICHRLELMERICVTGKDEEAAECGVYGFVFWRDGAWIGTVIDDQLLLKAPDFANVSGDIHDPSNSKAWKFRKDNQTGSKALFFAACRDENETWLPLLEKAYAKIHGDYNAIWGGWVGEGVEDLTGGVSTEFALEDVLSKGRLWKELINEGGKFVFGLDILGASEGKNGLANAHAYSLLEAREETDEDGKMIKLVKIRNPWGEKNLEGNGEWQGPWSDGSKEWTPYWLNKLNYRFENDGVFWMTYSDMLNTFTNLYRTRLFDDSWTVAQEWTSVNVAWLSGYLQRKFIIEVKTEGTVVIVLQQLDTRYFKGLEGQYTFLLHFILQKQGAKPGDYICRIVPKEENFLSAKRSISCEVDLEPGIYEVLPKITTDRNPEKLSVDVVVEEWAEKNPKKLRQVGLSYDLAHSKVFRPDPEPEVKSEEKKEESTQTEDNKVAKDEVENRITRDEEVEKKEEPKDENKNDVEKKEETAEEDKKDEQIGDEDDVHPFQWSAVAVIGLRVYLQNSDITLSVAGSKNAEEGASVAIAAKDSE
ncbi:putative calpain [Podospora fimiseda]|uniref:Calpain n=1 Tax=Podospora fimiseda TaxID=252190 RepID=A0AAN7BDW4_9PEZI|nr:putative calpain [Podospora fimiseda]